MTSDRMTDEESRRFWSLTKDFSQKPFNWIREVCEVALLGGALLVAQRFTESFVLRALYWLLISTFALRVAGRIAFPSEYNTPIKQVLLGSLVVVSLTYIEDSAIRAAARAAIIQLQSEKVEKLLAEQKVQKIESARIYKAYAQAGCLDDERVAAGTYKYKVCNKIAVERYQNDHRTSSLLQP